MTTAVLAVMLVFAGCSSDSAVSEAKVSELAGMYEWDPEGSLPDAVWSGTLVIDGPCVYLDVSRKNGVAVPESETLRSFIRLSEPLTRFDAATGEVWVGEHGPMSTDDEVVIVGSEGWQQDWNDPGEDAHLFEYEWVDPAKPSAGLIPVCSAPVSLYAASMGPSHSGVGRVFDLEASTRIAGLYPSDRDLGHHDVAALGVLIVDAPCLYIQSPGGKSRSFLRLPRPSVRFDAATGEIWVGTRGPMTTGDEVRYQIGASEPNDSGDLYEGGCSAQAEQYSVGLSPSDGQE